jgi:Predicted sugar nucleotidyltransferases
MYNSIKDAVILAAGLGTRFGTFTDKMPKGFIPIAGKAMVIRSIEALIRCGIEHIYIGTGYKQEMYEDLKKIYTEVECCYSPRYAETNSMYTLYNMRDILYGKDFLLLESDIVYEDKALTSLVDDEHESTMLITPVIKFQDQYYVEYDKNHYLTNCSTNKNEINYDGELVGIHKISKEFYRMMCSNYSRILEEKPKLGYEYQILSISKLLPVYVLKLETLKWYEIDDLEDRIYAENNIMQFID